ncbi:IS701 family transposase [Pseudarthrobacter psychrotolerans]|uniref:IS701 family transposase n=1 Tax=Pseudarthrobacter psychrotolerans TaxID=2697569 RepID=A0A6P1NNR7_9MICC|nr:IS701 family transposase [Pseudarthrobacter psychrotolerans]QHK22335.1 IS701 family transposase [Pseudarthrobacter psychrotolerans]
MREWADGLEEIRELIGGRFARSEPRENAVAYLQGLLSSEERKNSWTLSERAGQVIPDRMQRLLSTTDWDPDALRDDLRSYVLRHLGSDEGILIVDETGFIKKGTRSAGVARQYSGTAGRIENSQIGVFLTYATAKGRTFLDRELYLPKAWTDDRARCATAGIPEDRAFATKPELAITMLTRALDAGVPATWVAGDAVYGQYYKLRKALEDRDVSYVLAVPMNQRVIAKTGNLGTEFRADDLIASLSGRAWRTRSAGQGAKGERRYAWARARINGGNDPEAEHWLLARRSLADPQDIAYWICHGPKRVSLAELVRVAGARWAIEETFQTAKGQTGLDHYQVRQWTGWYRHITLSMLAHAFLTVTRSKKGAHIHTTPGS